MGVTAPLSLRHVIWAGVTVARVIHKREPNGHPVGGGYPGSLAYPLALVPRMGSARDGSHQRPFPWDWED